MEEANIDRAIGVLRIHPTNPRYFTDGSGKAVYLTGSHHWNSFQDRVISDRKPFDYNKYLDFFQKCNHNFIRLWVWEGSASVKGEQNQFVYEPLPYQRTGTGIAFDDKPKFDLSQFNQTYFDRLRQRVISARDRGIYVSIMLFQGWSIERKKSFRTNPWVFHPFNQNNNINGVNGDANGNGEGEEVHTLSVPEVTRLQESYIQKVIDAVNDLDNVLYEITNESPSTTKEWQYHIIRYIKQYEASKPKQHPVGMTYFYSGRAGTMGALFASPADWISPSNDYNEETREYTYHYNDDPPISDGQKIILSDTDHIFGVGGNHIWVWKTFMRGHNPIYMDPIDISYENQMEWNISEIEQARVAMGHTRYYAQRMNLAEMTPRNDLASTQYCLANPGKEYLVYLPDGGKVTVDLSATSREFKVEWFNPRTGNKAYSGTVSEGLNRLFQAPFNGDAVIYIY